MDLHALPHVEAGKCNLISIHSCISKYLQGILIFELMLYFLFDIKIMIYFLTFVTLLSFLLHQP